MLYKGSFEGSKGAKSAKDFRTADLAQIRQFSTVVLFQVQAVCLRCKWQYKLHIMLLLEDGAKPKGRVAHPRMNFPP